MFGGTYICEKDNNHRLGHFSSDEDKRLPCLRCNGWMYLKEVEVKPYKKPNIIWVGIAHVIWFFLKPIDKWLSKYDVDDDDC